MIQSKANYFLKYFPDIQIVCQTLKIFLLKILFPLFLFQILLHHEEFQDNVNYSGYDGNSYFGLHFKCGWLGELNFIMFYDDGEAVRIFLIVERIKKTTHKVSFYF